MAKQHKTQGPGTFSPLCPRARCWFTRNMSMPMHHINICIKKSTDMPGRPKPKDSIIQHESQGKHLQESPPLPACNVRRYQIPPASQVLWVEASTWPSVGCDEKKSMRGWFVPKHRLTTRKSCGHWNETCKSHQYSSISCVRLLNDPDTKHMQTINGASKYGFLKSLTAKLGIHLDHLMSIRRNLGTPLYYLL